MSLAPQTHDALADLLGKRFSMSSGVCAEHGTDISHFEPQPPDAVVFPESTAEVQAIVKACAATRTPIVPYGVGTSLEGNIHALEGGVSIDLSRMDRVIAVNTDDQDVVVQPRCAAQAAERLPARHGAFLSDRSRRGRDAGWHGGDTRIRYQRRALWHDERQRAESRSRDARRRRHSNGAAGAKIVCQATT